MLVLFCFRLATGLIGSLLLFSPHHVNPRFYRAHFLIALGLLAASFALSWSTAGMLLQGAMIASMVTCFLGSVSWSLDRAPAGRSLIILAFTLLVGCLALLEKDAATPTQRELNSQAAFGWRFLDDLTSAGVLGTATTAMLMGHSYLIAPSMSLAPLMHLLAGFLVATLGRILFATLGLWQWSADHSLTNLGDVTVLWLPLRWGLGFLGPLLLAWMAWQAARIRSTQSATGILYVVVIFCFLGELTSQLLWLNTGSML